MPNDLIINPLLLIINLSRASLNAHSLTLDPLLVLIEYVPYGDLLGYLRKSRGLNDTYFKNPDVEPQTNLTAEQLIRFAWQIADGMFYLSSRKVCVFFTSLNLLLTISLGKFFDPSSILFCKSLSDPEKWTRYPVSVLTFPLS